MSDDEFKYAIDMNKIKNNKLFNKFVKGLAQGQNKPKEEPITRPVQYRIAYQANPDVKEDKPKEAKKEEGSREDRLRDDKQREDRSTLLKPTSHSETAQQYKHDQSRGYSPASDRDQHKDVVKTPIQQPISRQNRRGTFRSEYSSFNTSSAIPTYTAPAPTYAPYMPAPTPAAPIQQERPARTLQNIEDRPAEDKDQLIQQYKTKLQRVTQAFEQFKNTSITENRQRKSELISYQETIEILKEKVYEVQSREDELVLENNRLKQKISTETVIRTRLEEEKKELEYTIQQLNDMMESKQGALRKKNDQMAHWKNQCENMKGQFHNLRLANEKLSLSLSEYEEEHQFLKRQKQNKESLQSDMKEKVAILIRENAKLKDEMHFMATKMADLQNQNFLLKTDIKRQNNLSQVFAREYDRSQQRREYEPQRQNESTKQPRRRGEFNREREKANEIRESATLKPSMNNYTAISKPAPPNPDRQLQQLAQQRKSLQEQVQKFRDLKAMSGAMRKKKIELERQLESVAIKMAELRGQPKPQ